MIAQAFILGLIVGGVVGIILGMILMVLLSMGAAAARHDKWLEKYDDQRKGEK